MLKDRINDLWSALEQPVHATSWCIGYNSVLTLEEKKELKRFAKAEKSKCLGVAAVYLLKEFLPWLNTRNEGLKESSTSSAKELSVRQPEPPAGACARQSPRPTKCRTRNEQAVKTFQALDVNTDGKLMMDELTCGLADHGISDEEIEALMFALDKDGDDEV